MSSARAIPKLELARAGSRAKRLDEDGEFWMQGWIRFDAVVTKDGDQGRRGMGELPSSAILAWGSFLRARLGTGAGLLLHRRHLVPWRGGQCSAGMERSGETVGRWGTRQMASQPAAARSDWRRHQSGGARGVSVGCDGRNNGMSSLA
jgi:hypothetical protein